MSFILIIVIFNFCVLHKLVNGGKTINQMSITHPFILIHNDIMTIININLMTTFTEHLPHAKQ